MILPATPEAIARAAALLRAGCLVAFPTETVYGLGGDATSERAVASIFATKGRPRFNPLIVHVPGPAEAEPFCFIDDRARRLMTAFWPGPLTLVLPRRPDSGLSWLVSAGLDTVAVRAPAHPVAQALLRECLLPLAAPSANRSGRVSPTTAAHVAADLGDDIELILDGGPCRVGVESTVLDLTGDTPALLRPGAVTIEELRPVVGPVVAGTALRSPGMLPSH
jgi:L-threonylcarbamoyladenylate synthase